MIELIAGLALASYCRKQWKKAFPEVTKEELLTKIAEMEQEITSLKEQLYNRISNTAAVILVILTCSGWLMALWVYLQWLKDLGR